jgi:hypothetical protein
VWLKYRHEIEIHDGEDGVDIDFDLEPVEAFDIN